MIDSSIMGLQKSFRTLGRIRIGDKVETRAGKSRPNKLANFRLTSPSKAILESAALIYGGTPQPWTPQGGSPQFELYVDTDVLDILIPPQAVSQWFELWSAAGCIRRCDGVLEQKSEGDCLCDPENRECKATTRLNVCLPNVPDIGTWMLETHGIYAAREIPATLEMIAQFRAGYTRGTLRIEQRTRKSVVGGKAETRKFAVPVIELAHSLEELAAAPVLPLASGPLQLGPGERVQVEEIVEAEIVEEGEVTPVTDDARSSVRLASASHDVVEGGASRTNASGADETPPSIIKPVQPEPMVDEPVQVVGEQTRIDAPAEPVTVVDWKALSAETGISVSTFLKWARSHDLAGANPPRKLLDVAGPLAAAVVEMARGQLSNEQAVQNVQAAFEGTEAA